MTAHGEAWLDSLAGRGMKLRLDAMHACLARLGNPHERAPVIHVGGTNGKGSVTALASAILREAGHRVGTYTSPHLVRFEERILVDGKPIPSEAVDRGVAVVRPVVEAVEQDVGLLTYFEAVTLLAYWWFAEQRIDVAVVEVGLGGRLDATNVHARPLATVVTNVALDHTDLLGTTVAAIAREKAAIARPGVPLLTGAEGEALDILRAHGASVGAPFVALGEGLAAEVLEARREDQDVLVLGARRDHPALRTHLLGRHQASNVALAVAACDEADAQGLRVPPDAVVRGVAAARWRGRLEWARRKPGLLLDGAHNPAAVEALVLYLTEQNLRPTLLVGCLADKDWATMARLLAPVVKEAVVTKPPSERALDPRELGSAFSRAGAIATHVADVRHALATAKGQAGEEGVVLVTGSLYLVGEVLRILGEPGV